MGTAEVAADDVWLALAAAEEPAGFGCELSLVAGPAVHGKAAFEVGVDELVGVELGRVCGQEGDTLNSAAASSRPCPSISAAAARIRNAS